MGKYPELVQYNITFPKLMEYVSTLDTESEDISEELEAGLGTFYPAPGGLADNIKWFLGDDTSVRVVSGKTYLYQRLCQNKEKLSGGEQPFVMYDALNCREGCLEGTAKSDSDELEYKTFSEIDRIRADSKCLAQDSPWSPELSYEQRLENLNKQFADLDINDYMTAFEDRSAVCKAAYPTDEEADAIFISMHKEDEHTRNINCSACGYNTCRDMMIAVYNGFNTRHNCVYSEKEESIYLAKMSFSDRFTVVMNRNAYERKIKTLFSRGGSLGLILADVNGLKQANDDEAKAVEQNVREIVFSHDYVLQMHGFYLTKETNNLRFDVVVSFEAPNRRDTYQQIINDVQKAFPDHQLQITLDTDFSEE